MWKQTSLSFILIIFTIRSTYSQIPGPVLGFPNLFCPSEPSRGVFLSCERDCRENHNALYGFCGNATLNDFSCYCSQPLKTIQINSRQCVDRRDRKKYDDVCKNDCLCDHGATSYYCNYKTHACECRGQSLDMRLCPHKNIVELALAEARHGLPGYPNQVQVLRLLQARVQLQIESLDTRPSSFGGKLIPGTNVTKEV